VSSERTTKFHGQLRLFDKSDDASPLLSRCTCLTLKSSGLELDFAIRAREIARKAGLDGAPLEDYVRLFKSCNCNFRDGLNRIESGELLAATT
jgi:hypothetical protein